MDAAQGHGAVENFPFRQGRLRYDRQERQFAAFDADRRRQHTLGIGQFLVGLGFAARTGIAGDVRHFTVFQGNRKQAAHGAVDAV